MRRSFPIAAVAAAVAVLIANAVSLFSAEAPRSSSEVERLTFILTIPASLLSLFIRSRDKDSIVFWSVAALIWAAAAAVQFSALFSLPGYMRRRPFQRQLALAVVLVMFAVSLLWLASSWPMQPQEEPTLFFIRVPLWFLTASAILLLLVWSPWRNQSDGCRPREDSRPDIR